jgi:hypothetical protein
MAEGWVTVVFAHFNGDFKPGDKAEVEIDEAKRLVTDGIASYATVPEAKKAGADPSDAATKK